MPRTLSRCNKCGTIREVFIPRPDCKSIMAACGVCKNLHAHIVCNKQIYGICEKCKKWFDVMTDCDCNHGG